LLDRIDLHIEVPSVPYAEPRSNERGLTSSEMRALVMPAHERQSARGFSNATILSH